MNSVDNEANGLMAPALELLATTCSTGSCPTIFKTDRGTILIQGYAVDPQGAGVTLAPNELLVEIPAELLAAIRPAGV
ncbi:MAG: hypothetical protein QOE51_2463 [Actinoplanes sp.]|jgi:hypothetical protein|nr:hypothetical protein [Actinoplanes sp.]